MQILAFLVGLVLVAAVVFAVVSLVAFLLLAFIAAPSFWGAFALVFVLLTVLIGVTRR